MTVLTEVLFRPDEVDSATSGHDGATPSSQPQGKQYSHSVDAAALVELIRNDEAAGFEQLYRTCQRGLRYLLVRRLGTQDVDDRLHEIFLIVIRAIRRGELREPARLMGFVRTVASRQIASQIDSRVRSREREQELDGAFLPVPDVRRTPEEELLVSEKREIMQQALSKLCPRDREILVRFYLQEQRPEEICREMSLTDTQFRLRKSRAKATLARFGQECVKTPQRSRFANIQSSLTLTRRSTSAA